MIDDGYLRRDDERVVRGFRKSSSAVSERVVSAKCDLTESQYPPGKRLLTVLSAQTSLVHPNACMAAASWYPSPVLILDFSAGPPKGGFETGSKWTTSTSVT